MDPIGALFWQWRPAGLRLILSEVQRLAEEGKEEDLRPWLPVLRGVLADEGVSDPGLRGLVLLCLYHSPELRILLFAESRASKLLQCDPSKLKRSRVMHFLVTLGTLIRAVGSAWTLAALEGLTDRAQNYWHHGTAPSASGPIGPRRRHAALRAHVLMFSSLIGHAFISPEA